MIEVEEDKFKEFLDNYKGEITKHDWLEVVLYYDFKTPTNKPLLSQEMMYDCLIAMHVKSPYLYCEQYYILDENEFKIYE